MSDSFASPWTLAHQAPLSMGIPRHKYCSGLSFCSPSDLPDPEIKPVDLATSAALKADSLLASHLGSFFYWVEWWILNPMTGIIGKTRKL